ncbi:aldehyde dehydrogenase (NAD(P)(+)) ald5 [Pleurotus pulmonarius]|nr:aldehyde dehydrogenase (NAD(P)(+)) ald5 [Pleurotus pulmonarius]KAF4586699.1 aldehyde dehydrogenase (NAD(P)(+)) ald5 [Pleurotus pulmonarius]
MSIFSYKFSGEVWQGETAFNTGLFIDGKFCDGSNDTMMDVLNPTTGKLITKIAQGTASDVDVAVKAARKAFETTWGLNASKTFDCALSIDVTVASETIKYYSGWADKITGQTLETNENKFCYTRHEPIGVVGQIIPWNFPLLMMTWKIAPALATGNCVILKPSEFTPLTALRMASLIKEAGFPAGVVNIIVGHGDTVGSAISGHMGIDKVAFTGSTAVGRKIMDAAAKSNIKGVTLELGGKSPTIVFDDADLEQAVGFNNGQACAAGSRIFVQEGIYDEFLERFTARTKSTVIGDPFTKGVAQGPLVSKPHFDRVMGYINSGIEQGATVHYSGEEKKSDGYFIQPTIFTDTTPDMKIVQEEIFGPVVVIIKFKDEDDVVRQANETVYGLAAVVFSQNITRALETTHRLKAGTVWVNCANQLHVNVPFGGYKQSGIGRELGEYALHNYTNVKSVQVNFRYKP